MKRKKILYVTTAILFFLILIYLFFIRSSNKISYLTEPVRLGNIEKTIIATGTVRSNNRVEVGAQASGKITNIAVEVGQKIKKGDLLINIDSMTQQNSLDNAKSRLASYEAQLNSKKIQLEVAQSFFKRVKNLYNIKSASFDSYEEGRKNLAVAKANVKEVEELIKQAKIDVNIAETNLSYTTIVSPIDGVVISIPVSVGQTINSSQTAPTIIQVADLTTMLIKPEIPEGDITLVSPGMKVDFTTLSNPNYIYKSEIISVDPVPTTLIDNEYKESVSDTSAVYYYANIVIDNSDNLLRIGMTTTSTIKVATAEDVLIVPTIAISEKKGGYFIKILENNKAVEKKIEIGIRDDFNTEIKNGLKKGDEIILSQLNESEKSLPTSSLPRF